MSAVYLSLGSIQILHDPLKGSGGVAKKITGGRGAHQKITGDHYHKEKIDQTEGPHKVNNFSQDLLSMGGSRSDIFIDQY